MNCNADALVLRTVNVSESDQILTVLAKGLGKISVSAKGARGYKSKFSALTRPFCYGNLQLFRGRELYLLNGGECIQSFFRLQEDLEKLALAGYFVQLLDALTDEYQSYDEALRLTLNCLYALTETGLEPRLLKAGYELRVLSLCGYMPDLNACHLCGAGGELPYFSVRQGNLSCGRCPRDETFAPLAPGVLQAMRYLLAAPLEKLFSFSLSAESLGKLCVLAERFTLTHLDRSFRGLDFYKTMQL